MDRNSLFVVTFNVPQATREQLQEQLEHLGYSGARFVQPCNRQESKQFLEGGIVIALMDNPSPISDELDVLAQRLPNARFLGLVTADVDWTPELVGMFDQIDGYPCRSAELGYRLRMLSRDATPTHDVETELYLRQTLLGHSPAFLDVVDLIRRFAPVDAPVLIEGETGTGKELAAASLHRLSSRAVGPWVPVNCGAIPDNLFETEMFGHAKGAFTDARQPREGLVEFAGSGTLFLDEVECLSERGQASLLRFMQSQEYRRVGDKNVRRADVRVVAATNHPLEKLVSDGRFREDLYYRLNILRLDLPALRERADDVLVLADYFLAEYAARYDKPIAGFSTSTREWISSYDWPGNARELENFVHREVLVCNGDTISVLRGNSANADSLGSGPMATSNYETLFDLPFGEAKACVIDEFERQYLTACLSESHGNVSAAAQRAGKHRRAFDRLLQKHKIDKSIYR